MNDQPATSDVQMQEFICLADDLLAQYVLAVKPEFTQMLTEDTYASGPVEEEMEHPMIAESRDLVFKLRSFMESDQGGDYALGVEMGMQRAAEMLENLIRRYEKGDQIEY